MKKGLIAVIGFLNVVIAVSSLIPDLLRGWVESLEAIAKEMK